MIIKSCDVSKPKFEDYVGLAADLAIKFLERRRDSAHIKDSEEYSIACEALLRAISDYKSDKSKFSTYAYYCIRNALVSYVRHKKYAPNFLDPKDIEEIAENRNCTLEIVSVDPALLDLLLSESKNERESDRIDKEILREHYLQQLTLQQIAINRNITKMRVKQRIDRAINRIKKRYRSYIGESE